MCSRIRMVSSLVLCYLRAAMRNVRVPDPRLSALPSLAIGVLLGRLAARAHTPSSTSSSLNLFVSQAPSSKLMQLARIPGSYNEERAERARMCSMIPRRFLFVLWKCQRGEEPWKIRKTAFEKTASTRKRENHAFGKIM